MFPSRALESFWDCYRDLPAEVRDAARKQYALFQSNPFHPSLRFKRIRGMWCARVTEDYRALALQENGELHWFWIGKHDIYERQIGR